MFGKDEHEGLDWAWNEPGSRLVIFLGSKIKLMCSGLKVHVCSAHVELKLVLN